MTEFHINEEDLTGFEGKVAIITGGSSGIGLATVELLVSLGALVVSGDIQVPPAPNNGLFIQTDVRNWTELTNLFKAAKDKHGRIDYVFANAGIGPRANYLALEVDEHGDPKEPNSDTLDINLGSVVNTATLAVHYMKQQPDGGSIVLMGSSTGLHPVRAVDYSTAKSGVLGFGRSLARLLDAAHLPIRVNTLAPSWTATQVLPDLADLLTAVGQTCQAPAVVARAAAYLMGEGSRHGEVVYVCDGRYIEIEKAVLGPAYEAVKGEGASDDEVLGKVYALGG